MYIEQPEEKKKLAQRIIAKFDKMKSNRSMWETHWQECMDYIIPRKNDVITSKQPGDKRGNQLFDTTAITANHLLSGALHGMLTNPSIRFFDLVLEESNIEVDEDANEWLQDTADKMFTTLQNTNFQTEIHEIYTDLGAVGTAALYMGEHDDRVIHFAARAMKEIFIDENNLGQIDTVYRNFSWTPKQIVQEFGEENCPELICKAYQSGSCDKFEIIHAVEPWEIYEAQEQEGEGKDKKIFKFKSCYVLKEAGAILSEGGFREFPYAVPRWTKTSGEIYGRGPGMDMLADIKMVNVMMETVIKGAQKTVDPPLMVADDGVIGKVRLTPGGLTVVRPTTDVPIRPLISDARIDFGYQAVEDVRKRIRAGFYGDLFQLREGPQMTATEVNTIAEQQMRLMGPILGRQHFELLRPLIDREFGIMLRRGLLSAPPKSLQGKKFDVRYSSLLAKAQRMSEGQNLARAIGVAAPVIQAIPSTLDNLDGDKALKYVMDVYGVPQRLMKKTAEVEKTRKARAEAQQQMAQEAQQMQQADIASKVMPGAAQLMQAGKK